MSMCQRTVLPLLILALVVTERVCAQQAAGNAPIKVMSFNIRYGTANDGDNRWENRKQLVLETITVFDPDLLGLQEALDFQVDFLTEHLPGYELHGAGRDDGQRQGEFSAVLFKSDRFEQVASGHFWLSDTPAVAGSKSWDSSLPRMVSWVRMRDQESGDRELIFANTHFDHRGAQARLHSAEMIRERLVASGGEIPVILTGDFNTTEDLQPYKVLIGQDTQRTMIDTFRAVHAERSPNESTFSAWEGRREGSRIDWILHTPEFKTLRAAINYTSDDGRNPSDHYPVEAVLRLGDQ